MGQLAAWSTLELWLAAAVLSVALLIAAAITWRMGKRAAAAACQTDEDAQTESEVNEEMARKQIYRVQLYKDARRNHRLRVVAPNGRIIIVSSECYKRRAKLLRSFRNVVKALAEGRYKLESR